MKWEIHAHTSEVSSCSNISAEDLINEHIRLGYTGIVITDHYTKECFERAEGNNWQEKVDWYLRGYKAAVKAAKGKLNVILGMELRFTENMNDYLVYGIDEEFLKKNPNLFELNPQSFKKVADNNNLLFLQAHPFRSGMVRANAEFLHGVEVFNGHPWHDSKNHLAEKFAQENNLPIRTSGSDVHNLEHTQTGGIITDINVNTAQEFVELLKSGNFSLIKNEKRD